MVNDGFPATPQPVNMLQATNQFVSSATFNAHIYGIRDTHCKIGLLPEHVEQANTCNLHIDETILADRMFNVYTSSYEYKLRMKIEYQAIALIYKTWIYPSTSLKMNQVVTFLCMTVCGLFCIRKLILMVTVVSVINMRNLITLFWLALSRFAGDVTSSDVALFNPTLTSDVAQCGMGNNASLVFSSTSYVVSECALMCWMNTQCNNFNFDNNAKQCEAFSCPPFSYQAISGCAHFSVSVQAYISLFTNDRS